MLHPHHGWNSIARIHDYNFILRHDIMKFSPFDGTYEKKLQNGYFGTTSYKDKAGI